MKEFRKKYGKKGRLGGNDNFPRYPKNDINTLSFK